MEPSTLRERLRPRPAAAGQAEAPTTGAASASFTALAQRMALRYGMIWLLIALVIVALMVSPGFLEIGNVRNILTQNAPVGLVAVGMTFVLIAGGFDLSVGAIVAVGSVLAASFAGDMPIVLAFVAAVACGVLAGVINGVVVTRLHVNPFIATLGTGSVFGGFALLYSDSKPIIPTETSFGYFANGEIASIPVVIIILVAVFVIGGVVLAKSVYGRSVYSVGGNYEAARLAGLRVDVVRLTTYLITGGCAALAGVIIASQTQLGQADIGTSLTLDSIAIVVIGGTSLFGGEGAMWRTAVGLLIIATITNVFGTLGVEVAAQSLIKGGVLIAVVALDAYARRRGI